MSQRSYLVDDEVERPGIEGAPARPVKRPFTIPLSYERVGLLFAALDVVWTFGTAIGTGIVYQLATSGVVSHPEYVVGTGGAAALVFTLAMQAQNRYAPAHLVHAGRQTRIALFTWCVTFAALMALGFLLKVSDQVSRAFVLLYFVVGAATIPFTRATSQALLEHVIAAGRLSCMRRVVIFGESEQLLGSDIAASLRRHGFDVLQSFALKLPEGRPSATSRELSARQRELWSFVRRHHVDEILLVFDSGRHRLIQEVADSLRSIPLPVRLVVDRNLDNLLSRPMSDVGAAKVIQIQGAPMSAANRLAKRSLDLVLAGAGLVVLAPLLLTVGLMIRADSRGPVFFRQRRAGFSGRTFSIYKFRTMSTLDDGEIVKQATRDDVRVTRVGRWLRKSSIDELPQLLNVVRGEMSLVGPRPHALSHDSEYDQLIATYALRHHVKPGITGWAQVNGYRGETSTLDMMERRVAYDLWYISNWSFWLDIRALGLTVLQVIRPKNVY